MRQKLPHPPNSRPSLYVGVERIKIWSREREVLRAVSFLKNMMFLIESQMSTLKFLRGGQKAARICQLYFFAT